MKLLNVRTLKVEDHFRSIPPYAILSHTWGDEEVSYQDMQSGSAEHMKGFRKVEYTCKQALEDGIFHVWIDTCCIDKTSSSELSEAINSMFRWYHHASVCYAYLSDVFSDNSLFRPPTRWGRATFAHSR
jgi:hypothetical protein